MTKAANQEQPSMLESLTAYDVIHCFKHMLDGGGWYIHPQTHKITPLQQGIDWTRNWIFTNPEDERTCDLFQQIFNSCGFIPSYCLNCYKVVVKANTVLELFKIYEWQKEFVKDCLGKDRFCKCGIEQRPWVHYQYGAYFYCHGLEQGEKRHKQVFEGLSKVLGKKVVSTKPGASSGGKVEVILKRYCTEFEIKLGPSNQYERTPAMEVFEQKILNAFDRTKVNPRQPPYLIEHVMRNWLEFAYDRGDRTAKIFNNNKPYYSQVVTYHKEK